MSEKEIQKAIIAALSEEPEFQYNKKLICKQIMKPFKDSYESKSDRKKVFKSVVAELVTKGTVIEEEDRLAMAPKADKKENKLSSKDKKDKKRKAESEVVTVEDKSVEKTKKSKQSEATTVSPDTTPKQVETEVTEVKTWPVPTGNNTILLFYAYCTPQMTRGEQDEAIAFCYKTLLGLGMTGRLRIAREGFNSTLTGVHDSVRAFTSALRKWKPLVFGETDFKYVDNLPDNQLLKGLKVWPVTEIVTYGFDPAQAPLDKRGTHLTPQEFHAKMASPDTVMIDVRNFNESVIGKFAPPTVVLGDDGTEQVLPADKVLDPCMRKSTEFPGWIDANRDKLEGKQILMYCTAGVRCERASAFMRNKGIENVFQLEGGIHRYLDAYPEDGGYWVGKNYTFDKRFNHGAKSSVTISECVYCEKPWDRYQAQKKCFKCSMEVILCKDCQKVKPAPPNNKLFCPLCKTK